MRKWIAAVTIGLILIAQSGLAQDKADPTQGQENTEQQPAEDLYPPVRVEIIENQAETDARQRREAESRKREQADLIAQEGMNTTTQRMADYAWWQNLATWVGAVLIFGTLVLMIQANRAASRAASEAIESTKLTRLEQRPWIDFDFVGFDEFRIEHRTPSLGTMFIENVGKSIAFNCKILSEIYEGGTKEYEAIIGTLDRRLREWKYPGFSIIPGNKVPIKEAFIVPKEISDPASERTAILGICVGIRYSNYEGEEIFITTKNYIIYAPGGLVVSCGRIFTSNELKVMRDSNRTTYS